MARVPVDRARPAAALGHKPLKKTTTYGSALMASKLRRVPSTFVGYTLRGEKVNARMIVLHFCYCRPPVLKPSFSAPRMKFIFYFLLKICCFIEKYVMIIMTHDS